MHEVRRITRLRRIGGALLALTVVAAPALAQAPRILFIRGGSGSGGFLRGGGPGADAHLSDVDDTSTLAGNTGFGTLKSILEQAGFIVEQVAEGAGPSGSPLDLAALDLPAYDVVVFGSNNAAYAPAASGLVRDYVCAGGGALFISDANWGSDWGDAPSSDQTFLDEFDLVMNQDGGTYALSRAAGDFVIGGVDHGTHPILAGPDGLVGTADDVDDFDGEGVSPATVTHFLPGVEPVVLVRAKGNVHLNDASGSGSSKTAGQDDGALVVAELGSGRVACHFDRNTFFNLNGAGTSIFNLDNLQYAKNLFAWLAGEPGPAYGAGCAGSGGIAPRVTLHGCPLPGDPVALELDDALGGSVAVVFLAQRAADLALGSCPLLVQPPIPVVLGPLPIGGSGAGGGALTLAGTLPSALPAAKVFAQAFVADPGAADGFSASNGIVLAIP